MGDASVLQTFLMLVKKREGRGDGGITKGKKDDVKGERLGGKRGLSIS